MNGEVRSLERMKEIVGLRWTEDVRGMPVTVRSCGLGWEAYSASPAISCRGRTPSDALGFYRFCLDQCGTSDETLCNLCRV